MTETLYRLVVKAGGVIGTAYALETPEIYIGRDAQNDIVVPEADVSRRHARLSRHGNAYVLEDLGSTNGTFVNGKRLVAPYTLHPGDEVQFGPNVVFVYEQVSDPDATVAVQAQTLRAAVQKQPQPAQPAAPQPAPPPPSQPAPAAAPPPPRPAPAPAAPKAKSGSRMWLYLLLIAALFFCGVVAAGLWYIDSHMLWCTFFPFLFPGACP